MALVNKSKIKEITEFSVSEEFILELEKEVEKTIKKAENRARQNNRRTIFARDL